MRIVDENWKEIKNPDLTNGRLTPSIIIKPDAKPVDNVTKHAWADDDYEAVMVYRTYTDEELEEMGKLSDKERIAQLEAALTAIEEGIASV